VRTVTASHPKDRILPALVWILIAFTLIALPLRVIHFGFLPPDDALRHAAKVVSGKSWSEILVLRPEITIDHNPGWHIILGVVHRATGWEPKPLVFFSIISMFLLFSAAPLGFFKRPEGWFGSLAVIMCLFPYFAGRAFIGRPLSLTMALTLIVLALWARPFESGRSEAKRRALLAGTTLLFALSAWIHGSWYLLIMIPTAFFLARQWRNALLLTACWLAGTILGAFFTGQPWTFLYQSALIPLLAFRSSAHPNALVGEFQPLPLANLYLPLMTIAIVLAWRKCTRKTLALVSRDPILWLTILGFILGLRVVRFWLDWGLAALALVLAFEIQELLFKAEPRRWPRLLVTAAASAAFLAFFGTDRNSQWSSYRFEALDARRADHAEWLPAPGGIIYSVDLSVFYQTFFTNPRGQWRYALGFEPSFMTVENLAVYDELCRTLNALTACAPWVKRMTAADRLVLFAPREIRPNIPELEWYYAVPNTWIGRLPRPTNH
jgi:hypothetical protein